MHQLEILTKETELDMEYNKLRRLTPKHKSFLGGRFPVQMCLDIC